MISIGRRLRYGHLEFFVFISGISVIYVQEYNYLQKALAETFVKSYLDISSINLVAFYANTSLIRFQLLDLFK